MRVVIEMSLPLYDRFVDRCNPASKEYALLKNGIIVRHEKDNQDERILEIHCDVEQAKGLLRGLKTVFLRRIGFIDVERKEPPNPKKAPIKPPKRRRKPIGDPPPKRPPKRVAFSRNETRRKMTKYLYRFDRAICQVSC
jgi:hypothetical protein